MAEWIQGRVIDRRDWSDKLFSLQVQADLPAYQAGQFTRLALDLADGRLARAYSFVNPPSCDHHEFLLVRVQGGRLSPALGQLAAGDTLWLAPQASGFLTEPEIPVGGRLWLLATGTGIGPFLSLLSDGAVARRFARLVLVHGVRQGAELVYPELIAQYARQWGEQFAYLPLVTREPWPDALPMRIPQALAEGTLCRQLGVTLDPVQDRVLLCGNPDMVADSLATLETLGFARHRRREPGQVLMENYWSPASG